MVGRIAEGRLLGLKQAPSTGAQWNERIRQFDFGEVATKLT